MEKKRDSFFMANKNQKGKGGKKVFDKKDGETSKRTERQNDFDNNRPGVSEQTENGKKPFDKKTYRLKKYSKKYKLEQWEEQRKKKLLHEYQKSMKNDAMTGTYKPKTFDEDIPDSGQIGRFVRHPDLIEKDLQQDAESNQKIKKVYFAKAKEQFNKVKEEIAQKQQEKERAREERMQKLQEYKKKKQERFKKLSKKTKKGQPVMSGRMELLLEKIKGK